MEMAKTYNYIGKAYSEFFNQVEPIEPIKESNNDNDDKNQVIKQQLIEGLTSNPDELVDTYNTTDDQPEFVRTGIKTRDDGTKLYRCRYKCFACCNAGTHYIYITSKTTFCHRCQHELDVNYAHPESNKEELKQDTFGNFFRAGDFKDWNLNWLN